MSLAEAADLIRAAYRGNSQVVRADAAYLIVGDWDLQCSRIRELTAQHAAAEARLIAERDHAVAELAGLRKQLAGPVHELNRILGGEPS
jgi:hypothetical protein